MLFSCPANRWDSILGLRFRFPGILVFASVLFFSTSIFGQGSGMNSGIDGGSNQSGSERQDDPSLTDVLESIGSQMTEELRGLGGLVGSSSVEWDSNKSPRDTVLTFLEAMKEWQREGKQVQARIQKTLPEAYPFPSEEVFALHAVFNRLGSVSEIALPISEELGKDGLRQFEVFPYALDHEWLWDQLEAPPRQRIVLEYRESDEAWIFSEQTLREAPALLDAIWSITPRWEKSQDREVIRRVFGPTIQQTPWWSWIVLIVFVFLGVLSAWFVRQQILRAGNVIERKTRPLMGSLVRSLSTSTAILFGMVIFILGGSFIEFTPILAGFHWKLVRSVLLFAFIWMIFGLTDLLAVLVKNHLVPDHSEYGAMTVTIIQRLLRGFVFVLLAIFLLENILGFHIGALLTGFGIVGLALSLAGKETAQNLFGAVSIFINKPFVVGDWIEFNDVVGEVADVRMHATHIRLLSGEMLIVPNMQFSSNAVENLAMRSFLRRELNIGIVYSTPPEKVRKAFELIKEVLEDEEVSAEGKFKPDIKPPVITFSAFESYYLNIQVYYWYFIGDEPDEIQRKSERGWLSYLRHASMVNERILEKFNANGIEFAFPVELEQEAGNIHDKSAGEA